MAMDGLALGAVIAELTCLTDGKIDKVQQPEKDLLLFTVRTREGNRKLLVSTHAENGRVQLTERAYDNPANAPAFCMLLRRRLVGGRVRSITQIGADRVCEIVVLARNEFYDEVSLRLVLELTGKHGNVLLLEPDGMIVDCLRRVSASDTSTRILLPGFGYSPVPPQDKQNPFEASPEQLADILRAADAPRALTGALNGVSRQTAGALVSAAPNAESLRALLGELGVGRFSPCVTFDAAGEPISVLPFLPGESFGRAEAFTSMSKALDRFYAERDSLLSLRRRSSALRHAVSTHLSRAQNKYAAFCETIASSAALEEARVCGELLLANLNRAKPGASELIAEDYYADPPVKRAIPLDPALSAADNAKRYFKQYRKGKLSKAYAEGQIDALASEIAYLEGQLENIDKCETAFELSEIRDELVREKYLRPERKDAPKPASKISAPMRFRSSDGVTISVGKNNRQNDALTLQFARPDNLWLHAKNIPGSHVIVDFDGMPPEQTLREAGMLAAYFSQAQRSSGVPVDYTPRRYVKKPAGARPGMVVYSTNRTLYVTPDAELVRILRSES